MPGGLGSGWTTGAKPFALGAGVGPACALKAKQAAITAADLVRRDFMDLLFMFG